MPFNCTITVTGGALRMPLNERKIERGRRTNGREEQFERKLGASDNNGTLIVSLPRLWSGDERTPHCLTRSAIFFSGVLPQPKSSDTSRRNRFGSDGDPKKPISERHFSHGVLKGLAGGPISRSNGGTHRGRRSTLQARARLLSIFLGSYFESSTSLPPKVVF